LEIAIHICISLNRSQVIWQPMFDKMQYLIDLPSQVNHHEHESKISDHIGNLLGRIIWGGKEKDVKCRFDDSRGIFQDKVKLKKNGFFYSNILEICGPQGDPRGGIRLPTPSYNNVPGHNTASYGSFFLYDEIGTTVAISEHSPIDMHQRFAQSLTGTNT
jgi:hypothetical protein